MLQKFYAKLLVAHALCGYNTYGMLDYKNVTVALASKPVIMMSEENENDCFNALQDIFQRKFQLLKRKQIQLDVVYANKPYPAALELINQALDENCVNHLV